MAFTPHWIDAPNTAVFDGLSRNTFQYVRRDGSRLIGYNFIKNSDYGTHYGYISSDSGQTWVSNSTIGSTRSSTPSNEHGTHFFPVGNTLCCVTVGRGATGNDVQIEFLNTTTLAWDDYQLLAIEAADPSTSYSGSFAGLRADGSIIIAVQQVNFIGGFHSIRIFKWVAGTVSEIGVVLGATPYNYHIHNGLLDTSSNLHVLCTREDAGDGTTDFAHFSVAAADDAISSIHIIETDVEINYWWAHRNLGTGCQQPDGTLAFPYAYRTQTNYAESEDYGELHVALGDTDGDPLNPSWSLTTVNPTPDFMMPFENAEHTIAHTAWEEGKLRVYYLTPYPRSLAPSWNDVGTSIWKCTYAGGWGTPELWFSSGEDADGSFIYSFHLVRDFTARVGIVAVCYTKIEGVQDNYAAYDGPPLANNYVSAGGPMVSRGTYASA